MRATSNVDTYVYMDDFVVSFGFVAGSFLGLDWNHTVQRPADATCIVYDSVCSSAAKDAVGSAPSTAPAGAGTAAAPGVIIGGIIGALAAIGR